MVQKAWLQGVVPAVVDSEDSVQGKALEELEQVLISQVKPYFAGRHLDGSQRLAWDLLGLLCNECQNLRSVVYNKHVCLHHVMLSQACEHQQWWTLLLNCLFYVYLYNL